MAKRFLRKLTADFFVLLFAAAMLGCNPGQGGQGGLQINNVLAINVSKGPGVNSTFNVPYTSVTVCNGQSQCQTIDHIQVDTGSQGLRLFKQVLTVTFSPLLNNSSSIAECENFGSGNAWGEVVNASVGLGGEPQIAIPIQIIDASFGTQTRPSPCDGSVWNSPDNAISNGILGIGVEGGGAYFTCTGGTCTAWSSPSVFVGNPITSLPQDNNGVILNFPGIPDTGAPTVSGEMILGIGTQFDNDPASFSENYPVTLKLDPSDPFFGPTTTDGQSFGSFVPDTGSNGFFFNDPNIAQCQEFISVGPWYCPGSTKNLGVQVQGYTAGSQYRFQFWLQNETSLSQTNDLAFNDVGAAVLPDFFLAGLPFFYGRDVYIVYDKQSSPLGQGPLYAFSDHWPPPSYYQIEINVATGADDARHNSEVDATLKTSSGSSIPIMAPPGTISGSFVLKPSDSADQCGNSSGEWQGWTSCDQHFTLTAPVPRDSFQKMVQGGALTLNLVQHYSFPDTGDNWNIEGVSVSALETDGQQLCLLKAGILNNNSAANLPPIIRLTEGGSGLPTSLTLTLSPASKFDPCPSP